MKILKSQLRFILLLLVSFFVLSFTLGITSVLAKGGAKKAARGNLQKDASVSCWQSHSDHVAGAIVLATGKIERLGKVDTELSMAYTWDFYSFNKNALVYSILDGPKDLVDNKDYTDCDDDGEWDKLEDEDFTATATFTVTTKKGDELVMDIVHGVVHEGPSNGIGGTTNEWLIGLEVNGDESTGKFWGASGTAVIRLVVESNNIPDILGSKKYVSAYDIYLKLGEVLVPPVE